jgi:hypothetical protein
MKRSVQAMRSAGHARLGIASHAICAGYRGCGNYERRGSSSNERGRLCPAARYVDKKSPMRLSSRISGGLLFIVRFRSLLLTCSVCGSQLPNHTDLLARTWFNDSNIFTLRHSRVQRFLRGGVLLSLSSHVTCCRMRLRLHEQRPRSYQSRQSSKRHAGGKTTGAHPLKSDD